jgi:hypothetical protein
MMFCTSSQPKSVSQPLAPWDRADGTARRKHAAAMVAAAFFRGQPRSSTKYATTTSRSEIVDVRAAMDRHPKKRMAHHVPAGMLAKTVGSTTKTNPGPP